MNFELSDEQKDFKHFVHEFVANEVRPMARHTDESAEFNWNAVNKMGALGLLGLQVPEKYGGAEMDTISSAIAIEELGWACGSTALAISAHNGLGLMPIVNYGSDALKEKWLPRLATGDARLAALGLTEPGAGSDLQGGVRTRADEVNGEWILNGSKMWMTNASIADVMIVLCRTDPAGGRYSLSMLLVPTDLDGIRIDPAEKKMGLKGSPTHAVTFDNVRVPLDNIIGERGRGLHQTLATLDGGRISIAALAIGLAQAAHENAIRYAHQRSTFGKPISHHQAIQWMIADAETEIQAARLMTYWAAWLKDSGQPFTHAAAMAKLFATEMSERVCRNAVQIHGGYGYSAEYEVERMYRDTRLMTIGEGTSEIQRLVISRYVLGLKYKV